MNNFDFERQKTERNRLLAKPYIERDIPTFAKKMIDSDLILVIMGPRRAGKSLLALHLLKDKNPAYVNFDDPAFASLVDYDDVERGIISIYGETKTLLFDEIQNIPRWELWVSRLQRQGYRIVLTGSNANLLSKELATHLTGRHIPLEIYPFRFAEWLKAKGTVIADVPILPEDQGRMLHLAQSFLHQGGFPELVFSTIDQSAYLMSLFESIILRDVIERYKPRFPGKMSILATLMVQSVGLSLSARKISHMLPLRSVTTLQKYLEYLEEPYLFLPLHRYSFKPIERLASMSKVYCVDNGYIQAMGVSFSANSGRLLENLVFTELLKMGFKINRDFFYYKTRNHREVDFILKKGFAVQELIQVCYDLSDPDVEKREVKALMEASEELDAKQMTILTWDVRRDIKKGNMTISLIPFWEWALGKF